MEIENELSYKIRGAIYKLYNDLGPGLLEGVYESGLKILLEEKGLKVMRQVPVPIVYRGIRFVEAYRMDLLVEESVIIEIKSIKELAEVHHKQTITYLKLSNLKLAILVNFNTNDISGSIFRKINTITS
jgi:GxxExxY protein